MVFALVNDPRRCRNPKCRHAPSAHDRGKCRESGCECADLRLIFNFGDAVEAISEDFIDSWEELTYNLARNDLPAVLSELWYEDWCVDPERHRVELAKAVTDAWCGAESPEQYVERQQWIDWLAVTGYIVNGEPAIPPETIKLYRGGIAWDRMAWTSDPRIAEWFRARFNGGQIWSVTVTGADLLMHINNVRLDESGRSEEEYVVNPAALSDETVELVHSTPPQPG